VHGPYVDDVVAEHDGHAVVVPLLLAAGFHVRVDVARAVAPWPHAATAEALGPDDRVTEVLLHRMAAAGVRPGDAVVLAAAGSSDDAADRSVRSAAQRLGRAWGAPVSVAYGAARAPRLAEEVTRIRAAGPGRRVVLVSYLLATGHFHRKVLGSGADVVTSPLLDDGEPDERLVDLVVDRFGSAARRTLTA
jgi:sirohydrochlorin ferrochelatase